MKKVATNFFKIAISGEKINVPYFPFEGKEHLLNFKTDNPDIFTTKDKSQTNILFWKSKTIKNISKDSLSLDINEQYATISNILAESLLKQFYLDNVNFKIRRKLHTYIITMIDNDISKNKYNGLQFFKTFHIHFGYPFIEGKIQLGFTISMTISESISWNVQDFIDNNIPYKDLDIIENTDEIKINSKSKFRLAHYFGYASEIKDELDRLNAIQNEWKEINKFVDGFFRSKKNDFILPDGLQIEDFEIVTFDLDNSNHDSQNKTLKKPECYFYNGKYPLIENSYPQKAKIEFNKPFTYDDFENREIKISIIYQKKDYMNVATFFRDVEEELKKTFKIKKELFKYDKFEIDNIELNDYRSTFASIKNTDLVIIVVDESHEALLPNDSPYYYCKSEFIRRGINTQEVQIQQIQKFHSDITSKRANYTHHNIALNIYAKLGGIAWTIKPKEPKNELVIGIGATTDKDGQPILGLTSIFRGDGKYLFGKISAVTGMANYQKELELVLITAIKQSIEDEVLNIDEEFHLIFHLFKPAGKDNEIKALKNVISQFTNYTFKYTFLHIGDGHNFRFFTYNIVNQKPEFDIKNGYAQNNRGTFIKVNDRLAFLGLQTNNSTFLKIETHKESTFFDLEYLATQAYQFAEMSHTSYNKSGIPVTIKYPSLMAYFAEKLKEIDGFFYKEIKMPDNSLWFI